MKRTATVVEDQGRLRAEILRPEACQSCHACNFGRQERMLVDLPQGQYSPGDTVELELADGQVGKASLIAYGIPLILFALGLYLANRAGLSEPLQALCALGALAVSGVIIHGIDRAIRKKSAYHPTITPCALERENRVQ